MDVTEINSDAQGCTYMGVCVSLCLSASLSPPCPPQSPTVPLHIVTVWHLDAPSFHGPVSQIPEEKGMSLPPWLECSPAATWLCRPGHVPSLALVQRLSGWVWPRAEGVPKEGWAGEVGRAEGRHTTLILRSGFRTPGLLSWLFRCFVPCLYNEEVGTLRPSSYHHLYFNSMNNGHKIEHFGGASEHQLRGSRAW